MTPTLTRRASYYLERGAYPVEQAGFNALGASRTASVQGGSDDVEQSISILSRYFEARAVKSLGPNAIGGRDIA